MAVRAVDGVSFEVRRGEVFGLLGPNRAGKTTLIKMLLSLCRPSSGVALRLGLPVDRRETLGRVGYIHENQAFPRHLTARELLGFYGALSGVSSAKLSALAPSLLERVGLADRSREPIARFSKGMAQRLALAQALLTDPELLVLDEPNEGLDLEGRRLVAETILERRASGRSTLLVSHVPGEAGRVCDRAAVIARGRLRFLGTLAELTEGGGKTLEDALATLYRESGDPVAAPHS